MMTEQRERTETGDMTKELLGAWFYGLVFGIGAFIPLFLIAGLAAAAAISFGAFDASAWIILAGLIGLLLPLIGPTLLSWMLCRDWKRAVVTAMLAIAASLVAFVLAYRVSAQFEEVLIYRPIAYIATLVGLSAAAAITTVFIREMEMKAIEWAWLGLSIFIGLGLVVVFSLWVAPLRLESDIDFYMIWQTPPIVWVGAMYFARWRYGRSRWRSLLLWLLLEGLSFAMPWISYPLLRAIGITL